jgi:YD repeat-containing protein
MYYSAMTEITTFVYDGNGVRVKKIDPDGSVTYYVRALQAGLSIYEVLSTTTGITKTSYYYAGAQRVAMRVTAGVSTTVIYLHGDHLGSTSLTTDAGGQVLARVLYYPYGEERYTVGTLQTDYGYTGQRKTATIKLLDYGARWYDPCSSGKCLVHRTHLYLYDPRARRLGTC